jgi:hypothetical protein
VLLTSKIIARCKEFRATEETTDGTDDTDKKRLQRRQSGFSLLISHIRAIRVIRGLSFWFDSAGPSASGVYLL